MLTDKYETAVVERLRSVVFLEPAELHALIPGARPKIEAGIRRLLAAGVIEYHPRWNRCLRLSCNLKPRPRQRTQPFSA